MSVWYWGRADLSTYITLPVLPELLESDFLSLTIKEEFLLEVFFVIRQKLLSTKVCEVPEELELLAESSLPPQEIIAEAKPAIKKVYKILFINFLNKNNKNKNNKEKA